MTWRILLLVVLLVLALRSISDRPASYSPQPAPVTQEQVDGQIKLHEYLTTPQEPGRANGSGF